MVGVRRRQLTLHVVPDADRVAPREGGGRHGMGAHSAHRVSRRAGRQSWWVAPPRRRRGRQERTVGRHGRGRGAGPDPDADRVDRARMPREVGQKGVKAGQGGQPPDAHRHTPQADQEGGADGEGDVSGRQASQHRCILLSSHHWVAVSSLDWHRAQ